MTLLIGVGADGEEVGDRDSAGSIGGDEDPEQSKIILRDQIAVESGSADCGSPDLVDAAHLDDGGDVEVLDE